MEQKVGRNEKVEMVVRALEPVLTTSGAGWRGETLRYATDKAGSRDPGQGDGEWALGRAVDGEMCEV